MQRRGNQSKGITEGITEVFSTKPSVPRHDKFAKEHQTSVSKQRRSLRQPSRISLFTLEFQLSGTVFPVLARTRLIYSFRAGAPIALLYPPLYIYLHCARHTANASRVLGLILKGDLCYSMKTSHCSSPSLVTQLPFGLASPHSHRIPTYLRQTTIVSALLVVQCLTPVGPA